MARGLHTHLPGERPGAARLGRRFREPEAVLEHAGPLSRPDLECLRVRPFLWCEPQHCPEVPESSHGDVCRDPAPALAQDPEEAPGPLPQGQPVRLRAPSRTLLNLRSFQDLEGHPKVGASWVGFLLDQIVRRLGARPRECYFWATHFDAELDLLVVRGLRQLGFEIRRTVSPKITPSMRSAMADLRLSRLDIVHAGESTYPVTRTVRTLAAARLLQDLRPIR